MKDSQTNWELLEKMEDDDIDLSDIPEVTAEQIARATFQVGGKPVARDKRSPSAGARHSDAESQRSPNDSRPHNVT